MVGETIHIEEDEQPLVASPGVIPDTAQTVEDRQIQEHLAYKAARKTALDSVPAGASFRKRQKLRKEAREDWMVQAAGQMESATQMMAVTGGSIWNEARTMIADATALVERSERALSTLVLGYFACTCSAIVVAMWTVMSI